MHSYFKRKIRRIEVTVRKGVPQEKQGRSKSETRKMIESPPQAPISFTLFSNPLEVPIPFIFSSNPPDVPNRFTLSSNPSRSSWDESISSEVVTCLRNQNLSYAARATSISPWKSTKMYEMWWEVWVSGTEASLEECSPVIGLRCTLCLLSRI